MANVDNSLQGSLMEFWLREAGTSDPYQKIICYLDIPFELNNDVAEKDSSCGTHLKTKLAKATINGNAVVNIDPTSTEASYDQVTTWQINRTLLDYKYQNAADTVNGVAVSATDAVYYEGTGLFTSSTLSPNAQENDAIEFSFSFRCSSVSKDQTS